MSFLLIKVGRSRENDVVLSDLSVSMEHLEIFVDVEGNAFLTDLGSENGTMVNGVKITDSVELKPFDIVTLGKGIRFDWKKYIDQNRNNTITVGRSESNQVVIDHPSVSEKHLQLFRDANGNIFITDLDSANGTFINGHRLNGIASLELKDAVKIGTEIFRWKTLFPDLNQDEVAPKTTIPVQPERAKEPVAEEKGVKTEKENPPKLPWYKEHKDLLIIYGINLLLIILISWQLS